MSSARVLRRSLLLLATACLAAISPTLGAERVEVSGSPGAKHAHTARAALGRLPQAIALFEGARYDQAARAFESIVAELPPPDRAATAAAFLDLESSARYTRVLSGLYANAGLCHFRARRYEEAAERLERALAIDGSAVGPRVTLGLVYKRQQLYEEAARWLEDAWRRGARGTDLFADLGEVHLRLGGHLRARWALVQARQSLTAGDPADWGTALDADTLLAEIDQADGRLAEAERRLRSVLRHAPGHVQARSRLIQLLLRSGRDADAGVHQRRLRRAADQVDAVHAILANQPGGVDALEWIADTYRALGLLHLADVHYGQLLARNPSNTKALLARHQIRSRVREDVSFTH
jgi:tetratricopeptide (TPR) repeat protein